jgi:GxxExxY protein
MNEKIRDSAEEVFRILGPGHSESTYQNALLYEIEQRCKFIKRKATEVTFPIFFKEQPVGFQRIDILLETNDSEIIIVELKSVQNLPTNTSNQIRRYIEQYTHAFRCDPQKIFGAIINFPNANRPIDFVFVEPSN